jgi:hypothetical protein
MNENLFHRLIIQAKRNNNPTTRMVAPNTLSKETQGFGNAFDCMICWLVFENSAEQTKLRVKETEKIIRGLMLLDIGFIAFVAQ